MRNNPGSGIVAQVMKPWCRMGASIDQTQAVTQRVEDTVGLTVPERLPQAPATAADQKWHVGSCGNMSCTLAPVACQCGDRTWVDGQLA